MAAIKIKSNPVKTVLVIVTGFLILHLLFAWTWALYASALIGVLGLISILLAKAIEWVWHQLTWVLSLIIPNILLSMIFFLVLTPVAWLSRLFGNRDPLMLGRVYPSTFRDVNKRFDKVSFEKPW